MSDDDKKHVIKKTFKEIGGTVVPEEPSPGDRVVHAKTAYLSFKGHPATIHLTSSGTLQAATASASRALAIAEPEKGDLTEEIRAFLKAAKKIDEATLRLVMASESRTFASIHLNTNALTESEAETALEHYFEKKAKLWGFWQGVISTILTGVVIAAITFLFFTP